MAKAANTELVEKFEQFYREYYRDEIGDLARGYPTDRRSLYVDWGDIYRFDKDLADDYLAQPEQLRAHAEEALRLYDLPVDVKLGGAHVRVHNLRETTGIRDLRARHVGRLVAIQGLVRKATDVRPKLRSAAFECQRCGSLTPIEQTGTEYEEPHECQGCERQGPFRLNVDQSEFVDSQQLRIQESPEGLRGGETPRSIDVRIEDDLTGEVAPGEHVTVTGIIRLDQTGGGENTPVFDIYMDGISVEIEEEQFEDMEITDADKEQIVELSEAPDIYDRMVDSIAPSIYGYPDEKLAMALQLFSGVTKELPDGSRIRGDLHILLIGDPGTGKCVRGDTSVTLADGTERPIREIVEEHLDDPVPVDDGVYDTVDLPVPSMAPDGSIVERRATKVWKREAPDRMYRIRTSSGTEIEVTPSHPVFVGDGGGWTPVTADELDEGTEIATTAPLATDGGVVTGVSSQSPMGNARVTGERIEAIDPVEPDYDWVYDLEVEDTHNYLTNNVVSHNSQLLQYIRQISPRSVYTSGKGSSAAGLCVTGDTLVHTERGFERIEDIVQTEIPDPVEVETATERTLGVYTHDDGEVRSAESSHVWRMPERPCRRIETTNGKDLEASENTPVLVCGESGMEWREISAVEAGDYVAVPKYSGIDRSSPPVSEYVEFSNEKVKLDDDSIAFLRRRLREEFGTLRDAAAQLDLTEDFIYDSLANRFVPLDRLDTILDAVGATRGDVTVRRAMLRHGDDVAIPDRFDEDLLYLVGLVFGDGDIALSRRDGNRGMVRISNGDETLLRRAADIVDEKFDKQVEIERQDDKVPCIRLYSATVARLLRNVGMTTPKDDLELDERLTTAEHADAFLRGLFDADGSVSVREDGGSSVQLSSISDDLARQVQLMLETYGVAAKRRERDRTGEYELPDGHTIESKSVQTHLEIYGRDVDAYAERIGFRSTEKRAALERIADPGYRRDERVPVGGALAAAEATHGSHAPYLSRGSHPGRGRARQILDDVELGATADPVEAAVEADLRWEEVVAAVDTGKKEVYDLTVPATHNFVGNGVVTHNTAAAVRDDFGEGQQWSLEAGALVLADQGIAAVDEIDKMRCVTGDTLVHTGDGIARIGDLAARAGPGGEIEELDNGRTIREVDLDVWTMTDDGRIVRRPVTAIHEYDAPDDLREVTLESGESVTATADHPFFVLEDGRRVERAAEDIGEGDWVYVPRSVPSAATDGGAVHSPSDVDTGSSSPGTAEAGGETTDDDADPPTFDPDGDLTPAHGAIFGYVAGDGNVFYDREEGSYGIRFTNKEEQLLADFERACRAAFDAEPTRPPSDRRANGVESVRLSGKEYVDELLAAGGNLETYDGKCLPEGVTRASRATKAAFVRALADSEGHVGERTLTITSSSYDLLLGTKMLLSEFEVTSQIQTREREDRRNVYLLVVTADESLAAFRRHVGFTLDRKREALAEACEATSGDRAILDVISGCGDLLRERRDRLRLHQSECGIEGVTYCNFENGDANASLHRARRILERFESRAVQAAGDADDLAGPTPSWDRLAELKERYHVSQRELADGTEFSQQQVSRHWGECDDLRETVRGRLREIIARAAGTDLDPLRGLVEGDVKWRRVSSVDPADPGAADDRIPVLRHRIADLLGLYEGEGVERRARELVGTDADPESWDGLRAELDRWDVSFREVADHVGVDGSTVSRWFGGVVDGEEFETVRGWCLELVEAKRERVRGLLAAIDRRRRPKVYDLTVEGTHNFLANGMVVHNSEDRSAMHEALEQQSYHPDTEVLLADGRRVRIGEFVDGRMAECQDEVVDGVDCEILPVDDVRVHSVDFEAGETTKLPVDRVSRHEAPDEFVRVTFSNGRDVLVTPEHPMFVDDGGEVGTVEAREIEEGAFVPAPRKLPNSAETVELADEAHRGKEKDVDLPDELTGDLAEILGFLVAEGHSYAGSAHEIGFSNQDERLLERMDRLVADVFGMESTDTTNAAGTVTKRWVSTKLYRWFERNFPEVMHTARDKRIPARVLGASEEHVRRFLVGAFAGDGSVETEAMAFSTASEGLANDYADALSKVGVASRIHHDSAEDSWKVYVMGDSTERFVDRVVEPADDRYEAARAFVDRSNETRRHHDVLPTSAAREIREIRRILGLRLTGQFRPNLDEGYGVQVDTVRSRVERLRDRVAEVRSGLDDAGTLAEIREVVGWSGRQLADRMEGETTSAVHYAEDGGYDRDRRREMATSARRAVETALEEATERIDALEDRLDFRYYRVTEVERVDNEGEHATDWVYDVTVEPTNSFVSQGVALHNSISISKAGINATLKSRCALLAAANPKYGRFDQYEPIGEQIDLEPALISRFDLIFTVTDQPDEEKDRRLADHILTTNYAGELNTQHQEMTSPDVTREEVESIQEEVDPTIDPDLLRKYVAYAKQNCHPRMTDAARKRIEEFYTDLRAKGSDEDDPVPITARKLEAVIRLAEASARIRLSDEVTLEDADRVIEIVRACLKDVGVDPESGEFDADVVETGTSKSQRDRIKNLKTLIDELADEYDDGAPREVIEDRAEEHGIDPGQVDHEITKLKEKGEIYETRTDHFRVV